LIGALLPFAIYVVVRNSRMPEHQAVLTKTHLSRAIKGEQRLIDQVLESGDAPPIEFDAGGEPAQAQVNLIRARQSSNLDVLRAMFYDAIVSRSDTMVGLRSANGVQWRKRIDGVWHALPTMDRDIGDAAVTTLKYLSNIDPQDRTPNRSGGFTVRTEDRPLRCDTAIGWQNQTEQLLFRFVETKKPNLTLEELGMFPDSVERLREALRSPGIVIVSANPGAGLSSTWRTVLQATDRVTRDWVALVDHDELETNVENIEVNRYDTRKNLSALDILRSVLLKQPEALVVPKLNDAATLDAMSYQVNKEHRIVLTRTPARSAAEAILRMLHVAGKKSEFISAVTAATGQLLARRLCDQCKQPMPVTPELIKQLGGDPDNAPMIYKQYTKPDPPPVDKKGRPIELEPCKKCAGVGYYGRVGLIELIVVDDAIRQALAKQPDLPTLTNLALQKRHQAALQQGYRHILAGTTSPAEIQRVFKESK
jgi:type II secretory ATPase GspE/PulE/Tfp pilus assembly ATPase PilB-like protein